MLISFFMSLTSLYIVKLSNLTKTVVKRWNFVKNNRKNLCRIPNRIRIRNQLKSKVRIRIRKKSFRIHNTATLAFCFCVLQRFLPWLAVWRADSRTRICSTWFLNKDGVMTGGFLWIRNPNLSNNNSQIHSTADPVCLF